MCAEDGDMDRYHFILYFRRIIPKSYGKEGGYYECKHLHGGDLWRFPR